MDSLLAPAISFEVQNVLMVGPPVAFQNCLTFNIAQTNMSKRGVSVNWFRVYALNRRAACVSKRVLGFDIDLLAGENPFAHASGSPIIRRSLRLTST